MGLFKVTKETKKTIGTVFGFAGYMASMSGVVAGISTVVATSSMLLMGSCGFYGTKLKNIVGCAVMVGSALTCSDAVVNIPDVNEHLLKRSEEVADLVTDLIFDEEEEIME